MRFSWVESRPARAGRRAFRPDLEVCETRKLLSAAAGGPAAQGIAAEVATAPSPVSRYRVFAAAINHGPHAGFSLEGPLILAETGRIQVFGFLYPSDGSKRVAVMGIVQGSEVSLRFALPKGGVLEVVGSGRLQKVAGGIAGGFSLVGTGHVSGPGRNDSGRWETLAPGTL